MVGWILVLWEDGTLVFAVFSDTQAGLAVLSEEGNQFCRDLGVRFCDLHWVNGDQCKKRENPTTEEEEEGKERE